MDFKVIVAGSRTFNNYSLLKQKMDFFLKNKRQEGYSIVIISGAAKGADSLAIRYAKERDFDLEVYPADWNKYGKSAGYRRNELMATKADALVAFWDGESKGTKHIIEIMQKINKPVRIVYF